MADVIVGIGRGILLDGTLPPEAVSTVRKAAELYREGAAPRVIMSGRWAFTTPPRWPRAEAAAMKELAVALGVPAENVLVEDQSLDTIGNAYFTKTKYLIPNKWRDVVLVATPDHIGRAGLIFEHVLGPDYNLSAEHGHNALPKGAYDASAAREARITPVSKHLLSFSKPGDDEALWRMFQEIHPGYSDQPRYALSDLQAMEGQVSAG